MFLYRHLVCLLLAFMAIDALDNATVNLRTKRSLSTQDLVLELMHRMIIDEKQDFAKAGNSVGILQRDSCTNIKSIGKPVTHNARYYSHGAWMKDPLGIMGAETTFVMASWNSRNVLEEYENMDKFKEGFARSNKFVKYNLRSEQIEAHIGVAYCIPRSYPYEWGGYSGMDLAVDEQGLWVLCGHTNNGNKLRAGRIDVVTNRIPRYFDLNTEPISSMGNAFVACGVIYAIDDSHDRFTTINFAYDTKTGRQWNPDIKFTNQYGINSMVDYNPREKVLYAWDNSYQVTYPITFEEQ
ncbi:myocilin-like isoform X2 [Montipora foliosa]|uniref:myocilin-like isoform X2 n=1 Tax=Montipora foliosa TaxID=591990 RepID=UPI0035F10A50